MAQMTVDNHLITQFSDMMHEAAQQIKSRLRPYVEIEKMTGDVFAYDGLGSVEAREVFGRIQPTTFADIDHNRRKISRRQFEVTLPIDQTDVEGQLLSPQGRYSTACVKAMERVFDRVVVESLFADVQTGRDFSTTVTFANDGGLTVNATAGYTYDKLLEVKQNFIDSDVGNDMPVQIVLGVSGDEHTSMMKELELVSGDFSHEYVIDKGEITRALGMDIVKFAANAKKPVLNVTSGTRDGFAMATNGCCVGLSRNWQITIKDRPDYVNVKQVQITGVLGAVRTEGLLVQKVQTTT